MDDLLSFLTKSNHELDENQKCNIEHLIMTQAKSKKKTDISFAKDSLCYLVFLFCQLGIITGCS